MTDHTNGDAVSQIGIVGTGGLGGILGEQFNRLPSAEVSAIADIDPAALSKTATRLAVPETSLYEDYERMLDDESLDAVLIVTPNGLHYEQTVAALDRGLHVLCEKPLTIDLADAKALVERDEASDSVLMVGYQRHLNPGFIEARERWALGDSTPTFVTAEITQDWRHHFEKGTNWRMNTSLSGGGHLYTTGTHIIDAILWVTGLTPKYVTARMDYHGDDERLDTQSSIVIEFENGTIANVFDSGIVPRTREHIHIWDDQGAMYFDGREWEDRTMKKITGDGSEVSPYADSGERKTKPEAFIESIRENETPPATARDALRATIVKEAAYESAATNERVEVPSP
ncbi:Gfo/Idh/MocA family protein [Haladaptatus sp. CMAA 1911]|uniref:Gfo/Idh/MocA family protein n=1 Tax=unclassified Haladaptatus TaxID=2622732 RepID=UPI00375482F8